ncbi:MAG: response regulator [Clostridium sp.]|nr:response regulator [Clostridium sp.]
MYHCHIHFYLLGYKNEIFEMIKEMTPFSHFTHQFSESSGLDSELLTKADVIFANLRGEDALETLKVLETGRKESAELILLMEENQLSFLSESLSCVKDIWRLPMAREEAAFRLMRWQESYKAGRDYWEKSQFLEAAINYSPNLIWFKDKDGVHEKVNDSFCAAVNKTKAQVEGRRHAYIWDVEEDDPACIESENEVMQKKETCVSEEVIKTGQGMRTLATYKSPLFDIDGSVMGTVGVAIDVTQELNYREEILRRNRNLERILSTLDCGVMRHTADGKRILDVNKAALEILGYESVEELMAAGFDMVAPSVMDGDREQLRETIESLKKAGDIVSVDYRVQHKNGEITYVMGNVKLLEENGELIYERFLIDYTDQKIQEKRKEKRQSELIQALSIDYNIVCFYDLDTGEGYLLQSNSERTAATLKEEMSLEEKMEEYIESYVHEDDKETLRKAASAESFREELEKKEMCYTNYRRVWKGETNYFQMKAVRAGNWEESHGIVIGFHSVDEEIRNEIEKKNLLEDALLQANRASKAKSVFLSNMSHDIRTPMNAIVGFTALALTHINNKEQVEEYLKKIMTSGNHLLSLINDILDMSRIESGKMHLDDKPCSLPDILHELRNILQADIQAKQLELYLDAVDVLNEEIICDKLRLNQVLLNLLGNSVKYTPAGGIVSMRIIEKAGTMPDYATYEFHIKDTGIGMSEEFVAHIFEPFEREKNTTISGIPGTGLGMAITKSIVDMMDGKIDVTSEPGVGTEFKVSFVFKINRDVEQPRDIPELKNCRALVVDDDFNTCDSVSYMLQQIGMRSEWTLSGKEAVLRTHQAVMRGDIYSVYVIDWMLPDMNGVEVTRRIRKEVGEEAPIIVLTAYDWADIEEEAKEAGVTAICSKPMFMSELRNCLYSIINGEKESEKVATDETIKKHKGRILLAEDNELNQEIAVEILQEAGFTTEVASNGQIAVDMLTKSKPGYYQLILMDVQMPVMGGYEATRKIRALEDERLANIPILAMTANAFEEDKKEALACGMNGHIVKPIDAKYLFETLGKVLG